MSDRIKVTINGRDMHGLTYQETHILDDFRKMTFSLHKTGVRMDTVQVEKIPDPEPEGA